MEDRRWMIEDSRVQHQRSFVENSAGQRAVGGRSTIFHPHSSVCHNLLHSNSSVHNGRRRVVKANNTGQPSITNVPVCETPVLVLGTPVLVFGATVLVFGTTVLVPRWGSVRNFV